VIAWAITGGYVCMAHGGAAPQVRKEAAIRRVEVPLRKAFDLAYARWLEECREWQVQRIVTTSMLMGIPPAEVTVIDMALCRMEHGVPGDQDTKPKIRVDRHYGPRS
jgi:hypothetical protein